ncbi:MAG: hypothetical protein ACJ72Z_06480 [Pyrinomonadaceae bacterium]
MKHCQTCGANYTDDTLRFCLEDGTPLVDAGEQPTVVRPGERESYKTEKLPSNITIPQHEALRVDIPPADRRTKPIAIQKGGSDFPWMKFVIALLAIGLVVVLGAGLLGVALYVGSGRNNVAVNASTPTPAATPTSDDVKKRLEDENAKLKKKLEESSGTTSDGEEAFDLSDLEGIGGKATVNSPKDGFLALRNLPNVQYGERIAKIPHEATINILMCSDDSVTIDGRTGHWCMVSYSEQVGWVFDAWLIRTSKN